MPRSKNVPIIIAVILTGLIVVTGYVGMQFLINYLRYDRYDRAEFIDPNTYQSIVLTTDQVYFGHLKSINDNYLILSDVYYIKIESEGGRLVKLGVNEAHGPQDKMVINQDHVVFWENLRPDSQVVKTIQGI